MTYLKKFASITLTICMLLMLLTVTTSATTLLEVANVAELQAAIAAVNSTSPGATIELADTTYDLSGLTPQYVLFDNPVTIIAATDATPILKGSENASYIIKTRSDNINISGITLEKSDNAPAGDRQTAIKIQTPGSDNGNKDPLLNASIAIRNVVITNGWHTAIDINGIEGIIIENVEIGPLTKGNPISITNSIDVEITGCDFSGVGDTAWSGGVGMFVSDTANQGVSDIKINGTTFADGIKPNVYLNVEAGYVGENTIDLGSIDIDVYPYVASVGVAGSPYSYGIFAEDEDAAKVAVQEIADMLIDQLGDSIIALLNAIVYDIEDDAELTVSIKSTLEKFLDYVVIQKAADDDVADAKFIRLVAPIDSLNYVNVGFAYIITDGSEDKNKNEISKYVYESVSAGIDNRTATNLGFSGGYLFTRTLTGIPNEIFDGTYDLKVCAYATTLSGTTVYGTEKTFTLN